MAKTQIRSTLESQNAQREKKIAQLNDFIARFSAGTRSSQVTSRRKESSASRPTTSHAPTSRAPTSLRPAPPSASTSSSSSTSPSYTATTRSLTDSPPTSCAAKRSASWAQRRRQDTLLKSLLHNYPGLADKDFILIRVRSSGSRAQIGYFPQDVARPSSTDSPWRVLHRWKPDPTSKYRGILGQMLFSAKRATSRPKHCRRRAGAPGFLQAHPHQAQHPHLDEPTNHLDLEAINASTSPSSATKARSC